jgi:hypothetical protein
MSFASHFNGICLEVSECPTSYFMLGTTFTGIDVTTEKAFVSHKKLQLFFHLFLIFIVVPT